MNSECTFQGEDNGFRIVIAMNIFQKTQQTFQYGLPRKRIAPVDGSLHGLSVPFLYSGSPRNLYLEGLNCMPEWKHTPTHRDDRRHDLSLVQAYLDIICNVDRSLR